MSSLHFPFHKRSSFLQLDGVHKDLEHISTPDPMPKPLVQALQDDVARASGEGNS